MLLSMWKWFSICKQAGTNAWVLLDLLFDHLDIKNNLHDKIYWKIYHTKDNINSRDSVPRYYLDHYPAFLFIFQQFSLNGLGYNIFIISQLLYPQSVWNFLDVSYWRYLFNVHCLKCRNKIRNNLTNSLTCEIMLITITKKG